MGLEQELDTQAGTGGTATLRTITDSSQVVSLGIAASGGSIPVVQAGLTYKAIPASTTGSQLGATGAVGDYLLGLIIIPATISPGTISIQDGASTPIPVFNPSAISNGLSNVAAFPLPLGILAVGAGWKVTTGANVSVIAVGKFT